MPPLHPKPKQKIFQLNPVVALFHPNLKLVFHFLDILTIRKRSTHAALSFTNLKWATRKTVLSNNDHRTARARSFPLSLSCVFCSREHWSPKSSKTANHCCLNDSMSGFYNPSLFILNSVSRFSIFASIIVAGIFQCKPILDNF